LLDSGANVVAGIARFRQTPGRQPARNRLRQQPHRRARAHTRRGTGLYLV